MLQNSITKVKNLAKDVNLFGTGAAKLMEDEAALENSLNGTSGAMTPSWVDTVGEDLKLINFDFISRDTPTREGEQYRANSTTLRANVTENEDGSFTTHLRYWIVNSDKREISLTALKSYVAHKRAKVYPYKLNDNGRYVVDTTAEAKSMATAVSEVFPENSEYKLFTLNGRTVADQIDELTSKVKDGAVLRVMAVYACDDQFHSRVILFGIKK